MPIVAALKEGGVQRTGKGSQFICDGARVQLVEVKYVPPVLPGRISVRVSSSVALQGGVDKRVAITYQFRQGSRRMGSYSEALDCDEGENTSSDGMILSIATPSEGEPVTLSIEATVTNR